MRSGNIIEYFVRLASFFHLQHSRTFINTHIHIYGYLCYCCYLLLVFFMSRALEERTAYTKEETILDIKVDILRISKNHRMSRIMSSTINSVGVDRMDQIWAERYYLPSVGGHGEDGGDESQHGQHRGHGVQQRHRHLTSAAARHISSSFRHISGSCHPLHQQLDASHQIFIVIKNENYLMPVTLQFLRREQRINQN